MRIALITNNYYPYSGGVVSSIVATTEQLKQLGHEVKIVTLDFLGADHKEENHVIRLFCPIQFTYAHNPMAVPICAYRQIDYILADFQPDIVHLHHPFLLGVSALKSAQRLNIPTIFTFHSRYDELTHAVPLPTIIAKKLIQHKVYSFCNQINTIVAPSRSVQQYIQQQRITTPITIIPSGLQPVFINHEMPNKQKGVAQPYKLITVGRFTPEKNTKFLLDVFAHLPGNRWHFMLIGYGPELPLLEQYAYITLGLSKQQVSFIHKPAQTIIAQAYQEADLFLFSSLTDVQPLVLVEAMASGTPVIALDGPGRDMIVSGYNGMVVADTESMVRAIVHTAQHPELHKKLQEGAWNTARQFLPQVTTQKLIGVYQELARKKEAF